MVMRCPARRSASAAVTAATRSSSHAARIAATVRLRYEWPPWVMTPTSVVRGPPWASSLAMASKRVCPPSRTSERPPRASPQSISMSTSTATSKRSHAATSCAAATGCSTTTFSRKPASCKGFTNRALGAAKATAYRMSVYPPCLKKYSASASDDTVMGAPAGSPVSMRAILTDLTVLRCGRSWMLSGRRFAATCSMLWRIAETSTTAHGVSASGAFCASTSSTAATLGGGTEGTDGSRPSLLASTDIP
mmetsp:Transcript_28643/g.88753  ORF Transcript_28643/g.88753 Transcript_28643/m.88753 type:complete len:249 (-) Transcript_28643:112-858(-)